MSERAGLTQCIAGSCHAVPAPTLAHPLGRGRCELDLLPNILRSQYLALLPNPAARRLPYRWEDRACVLARLLEEEQERGLVFLFALEFAVPDLEGALYGVRDVARVAQRRLRLPPPAGAGR